MSNIFDVIDIEDKIGINFTDKTLLKTAFTHSSFANEKKIKSNENLEFLGDSILNFIVADLLYAKYDSEKEGLLSVMRSNIVSARPLGEAVKRLQLEEHMFLGVGASKNSTSNENIYADLFESIVAAIYLDKGIVAAKKFVTTALKPYFEQKPQSQKIVDYKTKLQEHFQKSKLGTPIYKEISKSGPQHAPIFTCGAFLGDKKIGEGSGKNKRAAEQAAAEVALKQI